jgi:hypothetical protein
MGGTSASNGLLHIFVWAATWVLALDANCAFFGAFGRNLAAALDLRGYIYGNSLVSVQFFSRVIVYLSLRYVTFVINNMRQQKREFIGV